jgi:alpha-1,3-rhamnosyl/mannosyltransferase
VTISEFSASEIARHLGVDRGRIRLARPGPPANADAEVRLRPAESDTGGRRRVSVLYVGSLFTRRRIPDLLRAFVHVRTRHPDARLVLVGDNRTQPPIDPRGLARDLGIASAVDWHEYVDDATLARLYADATVFVFLSEYEGFALTPFEAIAHGAPPVLLDTPIAREVYGDAARLTTADPAAIADAIAGLLEDDAARRSLLAAGRQRLAALSWRDPAAAILAALEEAVAS